MFEVGNIVEINWEKYNYSETGESTNNAIEEWDKENNHIHIITSIIFDCHGKKYIWLDKYYFFENELRLVENNK